MSDVMSNGGDEKGENVETGEVPVERDTLERSEKGFKTDGDKVRGDKVRITLLLCTTRAPAHLINK